MTLKEFISQGDKFANMVGVELLTIREGYAKTSLLVTTEHLNAGDVCQGGAIFTLADLALAAVCNSGLSLAFAIDSAIYYHKSGKLGDTLTAEAHLVNAHPKVPYCEVKVKNQHGELIASFQGTCYCKRIPLEGVESLE